MRSGNVAAVALLAVVMAGCSGSSSPGSVTTPTPSPSSSTGPTPAPTANTNLGNMTVDRSFEAPVTTLMYGRTSDHQIQFTGVSSGTSTSFSYLAGTTGWQTRNITGVRHR